MRTGRPSIFKNRAPARNILEKFRILRFPKVALPRETMRFLRFDHFGIFENLTRNILEISSIYLHLKRSKLHSRAEHSENFDVIIKNRAPARDILKILSIYFLKSEVLGRTFWYRIRRILRSNFDRLRNDFYTNSIPNCFALKVVLFQPKSRSRAEHLENFDENRALPCGAS